MYVYLYFFNYLIIIIIILLITNVVNVVYTIEVGCYYGQIQTFPKWRGLSADIVEVQ